MSMALGFGADDSTDAHDFLAACGAAGIGNNPERRLMFEVLCDAVRLIQGGQGSHVCYGDAQVRARRRSVVVEEAEGWLYDDNDELFGFVSVCQMLGINPQALRTGLGRWRMRRDAGEPVELIGKRRPANPSRDQISMPRYKRKNLRGHLQEF